MCDNFLNNVTDLKFLNRYFSGKYWFILFLYIDVLFLPLQLF
jgi:hypothetical protein